jgi:hypothetical protein
LSPVSIQPDAFLAKRRDSLSRRFFDCIGNGKDAGGLSVDPDEDGGRAVLAQLIRLRLKGANLDPVF